MLITGRIEWHYDVLLISYIQNYLFIYLFYYNYLLFY